MSPDELDRLASRILHTLADQGVVGTSVRSYEPPVIALTCESAVGAEHVKLSLELGAERARIEIDPIDLSTVLRFF